MILFILVLSIGLAHDLPLRGCGTVNVRPQEVKVLKLSRNQRNNHGLSRFF